MRLAPYSTGGRAYFLHIPTMMDRTLRQAASESSHGPYADQLLHCTSLMLMADDGGRACGPAAEAGTEPTLASVPIRFGWQ